MPSDPNYDRNEPNLYRKEKSGSGWVIAGVIALAVVGVALYQNRVHNANYLQNIEPAAGSVTNTYSPTNTTGAAPVTNPATNTTNTMP